MPVPHYYFDIRDGKALAVDEEGLSLMNQRAAEIEAALSLADTAKDLVRSSSTDTRISEAASITCGCASKSGMLRM
ncbi:DUF6894 family protein [Bradyrhizobium sp. cir1]|uniref:DUF6894 family protein n=1 Tax=Bradyrhizobium sp. cir1 TaxID=1445730 RepID=UPI003907EA47